MKINHQYDQDMCICEELIPGTVEWHKEEGGDNILLQYINGGEGFRAIERFPDDVFLTECHYNGSGLFIKNPMEKAAAIIRTNTETTVRSANCPLKRRCNCKTGGASVRLPIILSKTVVFSQFML